MKNRTGAYVSGRFPQRIRTVFTTEDGLSSDRVLCVRADADGTVFAGTDRGLCRMKDGGFVSVFEDTLSGAVQRLRSFADGSLAVLCGNTVFAVRESALHVVRSFDYPVADFCEMRGLYWFLTEEELIVLDPITNEIWVQRTLEGGKGHCLAVSDTDIYVATDAFVSTIHGKRREWKNMVPAFCTMPSDTIRAMRFDGAGYLWVGSQNGAAIYDNTNLWITPDKLQLPQNAVNAIAADGVGGVWFASDVGVIHLDRGELKYYSADRWVPQNDINDLFVTDDGETVYAAADKGLSILSTCDMTLADKAALYEDTIENYHVRRGFVATRIIHNHYDLDDGYVQISDNDGLWTSCYVAAQSFRYAATADKTALEHACRGMHALLLLTRVSGIPGFTARAVRYAGEYGFGDGSQEWHASPDGTCEWKGETSSDEMTGHFFGGSVYYDLCADETEKAQIRDALCGIMEHILQNGFRLVDADGLPTTWACWNPAQLNNDDKWIFERGVNSLELLAFLKVCFHITGNRKYDALYRSFIREHHYLLNAARHKIRDAHICHIDDNLAFLACFTLLRLETDPAIRALLLCGMEDHWRYERVERQPLFCFIHALFSGRDADLVEGVQSLREMPLDMIHYAMENSKRKGLVFDTEQEDWHEQPQILSPLPFDERNVHRPDNGGFTLDVQSRNHAQEPTVFLLPYWLGRYFGLLRESDEG